MDPDDETAFAEFVTREWSRLVRVAHLLTGDVGRAEDLVQQTLVKVHRHWRKLHHEGSPYAYTRAALVNQSTSWWRRKRVDETLGDIPAHADHDPRDAYAGVDNRDALIQALRELPPRMRAVIVLRYYDDLTEAETAHALGISVGSVKSQTSRGLDRLRTVMSEPVTTTTTTTTTCRRTKRDMSIETQLRDALRSEAAAATSPETEPYARVHAAVIRHRRRRRAVGVGAAAAVTAIAIAIGVPTVTSRLGNEALPAGQHPLPAANDTAWNSVTTWPIRGALAANGPLVDAVQDKFNGRAVFVEDVDTARVALVVRDDRLLVVAGPRGAGGQALTQSTEVTAPRNREDGLLSVGAGSSLVILTTPDRTSAEVSGTPDIALDGTVTRSWVKLPLAGGIGRSARSPMTRFRLGSFAGPVKFRLLEDSQSTEPGSCVGDCNPPQAVQESDTTADIAWQLGLDPTQIKTTTVFNGEVPRDDVTTSGSTASVTPAPSLHVMHSRLPGGQVLRTAWFRSGDEQRSIDLGGPIDARRAAAVPLVINATGNDTVGPTNVRVFVASGTGLRAFSDSSSSEVIPITGRIAVLTLPVTPNDFWSTYRIEILEGGDSLGTFPVTHPLADPFEIAS